LGGNAKFGRWKGKCRNKKVSMHQGSRKNEKSWAKRCGVKGVVWDEGMIGNRSRSVRDPARRVWGPKKSAAWGRRKKAWEIMRKGRQGWDHS